MENTRPDLLAPVIVQQTHKPAQLVIRLSVDATLVTLQLFAQLATQTFIWPAPTLAQLVLLLVVPDNLNLKPVPLPQTKTDNALLVLLNAPRVPLPPVAALAILVSS